MSLRVGLPEDIDQMSRVLKSGFVYFLCLREPAGTELPPYCKIGITTGEVQSRIDTLQTGNPLEIFTYHSFETKAAEMVERQLHHHYSDKRVRLEWFRLTETEVKEAIQVANNFKKDLEKFVDKFIALESKESNGATVPADSEALRLHTEAVEFDSQLLQYKMESNIIRSRMEKLTSKSRGIIGVTRVLITKPKPSFKAGLLKAAERSLYDTFCTDEKFKSSFRILNKRSRSDFPELRVREKEAKETVPKLEAIDVEESKLDRDERIAALHQEYIGLQKEAAETQRDFDLTSMRLRVKCGLNEGISDVCHYKRAMVMKFDEDSFRKKHPVLHEEYTTLEEPKRRFQVMKTRDY
ncbi:MAG: GIY-YIG nuclease family protein [SAR324 cluster bacterium]|nr:GIY-YIG nuclease family protein [SAR324 cluster bacterium]